MRRDGARAGRPTRPPAPDSAEPSASAFRADGLVLLGEFGRAQGLRGEVRLKSYTGDPVAVAGYGPLSGDDGQVYRVVAHRQAAGISPDMLVVRVAGIDSREAAERLNRVHLYVPRERLGAVEERDEFFLADLIGLRAFTQQGEAVGTVSSVPNYGGGDLLEIAPEAGGPTLLIPFTAAFVPTIDLSGGRVTIVRPEETGGEVDELS